MKAPARNFRLTDWYGEDWDPKKPLEDGDAWVSPWAKAHYKLRQQELEIEQCEFLLQQAVEAEDYSTADGLQQRAERLRSQHPILPREQRIAEALAEENFALAAVFQKDLEMVKKNLGLPKYVVGQAVTHEYRERFRGVIMDVDLVCSQSREWIEAAGCLERGCALGYPSEETDRDEVYKWAQQPFYLVLPDLADAELPWARGNGTWPWRWPEELAAWNVAYRSALPAPLYLPEDALGPDLAQLYSRAKNEKAAYAEQGPTHPELDKLFSGYETNYRGRFYSPAPRLRLWQRQRAKEQDELRKKRRAERIAAKNPYDEMTRDPR